MAATAMAAPALAGDDFNPLGDGAGFNNADLLRDTTTGCENCAPNPPHEWDDPAFDIDWSLALRGAYVQTTTNTYFEATAVPTVTLRHDTLRGGYSFSASAEINRSTIEELRIGSVSLGATAEYNFDTATVGTAAANLQVSRGSPTGSPTIIEQPLTITGDGEVSAEQQFGLFVATGRLNGSRSTYGPTTLVGPATSDNSSQDNWVGGGGLRVGYRFTPILTAFVDGTVSRQWYDKVSPVYLVRLDAYDYEARTGVSATLNSTFEAEASIGYGQRQFVDASLGQSSSILYDASVTYRPDETVEAKGAFTTTFGAPGADSSGTARLEYAATGDLTYTVNPWLKLRTSAGWSYAELIGTADTETRWNAGAGADYALNEFTSVTADYAYARRDATPNPVEESHRVTLGMTFHD